jgi:DUF3099 family protein
MSWSAAAYGRGVEQQSGDDPRTDDGPADRGRAAGSRRGQGPAFVVTSARPGHTEEMSGRLRRYLISMTIRVIFLVLAIFVFSGWLRIVGIAAAVVLPWIAVVMANAGPTESENAPTFIAAERLAIDGPPTTQIGPATERPR